MHPAIHFQVDGWRELWLTGEIHRLHQLVEAGVGAQRVEGRVDPNERQHWVPFAASFLERLKRWFDFVQAGVQQYE